MTRIRHSVEMVGQVSSPVCWVACAMMIMQFKRGISLQDSPYGEGDPRDSSIQNVDSAAAVDRNLRAWGFTLKRLNDIRHNSRTGVIQRVVPIGEHGATMRRVYRPTRSVSDVDKISYILDTSGPFILSHHCGAFSYGPNVSTPTTGKHAVVVTGIDTTRRVIFFNNPWGPNDAQTSRHRDVQTSISSVVNAIHRYEATEHPAIAYLP